MMHRVRSLVTVIALAVPAAAHADADAEIGAYAGSQYSYCDAKLLASVWKQSISDSKLTIGRKLLAHNEAALTAGLADARKKAARKPKLGCTFLEAGFSDSDAQRLAKLWKVTAAEARTRTEAKILYTGGEALVRDLLREEDVSAFASGKYTYCDAKLLSGLWKQSISEAKSLVISKLRANDAATVDQALVDARKNATRNPKLRCSYSDGFTFDDAEKLAKIWNKTTDQAKALIEAKLLAPGGEAALHKLLAKPAAKPPAK